MRVGILTVSDRCARGAQEDRSGNTIEEWCGACGYTVSLRDLVPDETSAIVPLLLEWADAGSLDLNLILTTGGTGFSPRDVTPEATKNILDLEIPGIGESMRVKTLDRTPFAILSRSTAGIRSGCLIVNLPGSPKGVEECLEVVIESLPHALAMIRGWKSHVEPN